MRKTSYTAGPPRDPHCSPEVWLIEPFDEEFELWTLGAEYGFIWALTAAEPDSARCRAIPRDQGIADIRELLESDPSSVPLAVSVVGDSIDVERAHIFLPFEKDKDVDLTAHVSQLSRVCARLNELQFEDGPARVERFDHDAQNGGATSATFVGTFGVDH